MDKSMYVTPRVNKALIGNYIGKNVRVVGQVQSKPMNGKAILLASDKGTVTVNTQPQSQDTWTDKFMEVIGKVNDDLSVDELFSTNFGNNFGKSN